VESPSLLLLATGTDLDHEFSHGKVFDSSL